VVVEGDRCREDYEDRDEQEEDADLRTFLEMVDPHRLLEKLAKLFVSDASVVALLLGADPQEREQAVARVDHTLGGLVPALPQFGDVVRLMRSDHGLVDHVFRRRPRGGVLRVEKLAELAQGVARLQVLQIEQAFYRPVALSAGPFASAVLDPAR
jgi:hypothetical protein